MGVSYFNTIAASLACCLCPLTILRPVCSTLLWAELLADGISIISSALFMVWLICKLVGNAKLAELCAIGRGERLFIHRRLGAHYILGTARASTYSPISMWSAWQPLIRVACRIRWRGLRVLWTARSLVMARAVWRAAALPKKITASSPASGRMISTGTIKRIFYNPIQSDRFMLGSTRY